MQISKSMYFRTLKLSDIINAGTTSKNTPERIISHDECLARLGQGISANACRVDLKSQLAYIQR
jgi:hypothetical protein